jgi:hypothetical protein
MSHARWPLPGLSEGEEMFRPSLISSFGYLYALCNVPLFFTFFVGNSDHVFSCACLWTRVLVVFHFSDVPLDVPCEVASPPASPKERRCFVHHSFRHSATCMLHAMSHCFLLFLLVNLIIFFHVRDCGQEFWSYFIFQMSHCRNRNFQKFKELPELIASKKFKHQSISFQLCRMESTKNFN